MLIKGILLFLAVGLLFFFTVLGIEYFLWLNSGGRFILFIVFILAEAYFLFHYILTPLFYLFKIKKGLSYKDASLLIGKHFPEVDDKLFNLLDLSEDHNKSELLLASIEQRSENLGAIPFQKAVHFGESYKFANYLIVPLLILGFIWITGNLSTFLGSYNRVVNYDLAYEEPAPFSFVLLSQNLEVLDSEIYTVKVVVKGNMLPKDVYIVINGVEIVLQERNGIFQYTFSPPLVSSDFYFSSNGIKSREYRLNVLKTPAIQDFSMHLNYPDYTNRPDEVIKGTGNAIFPEGTIVKWELKGRDTESVDLFSKDTVLKFNIIDETYQLSRLIYSDFEYQISTSNENVKGFEKLDYRFKVIKDDYPTIKATQIRDSLNSNVSYFIGEASDDYLVSNIKIVYYEESSRESLRELELSTPKTNFSRFYYTFPSGLDLEQGRNYNFYFETTDNDAIHKGKTSKSQVFTMILLDEDQLRNEDLNSQQSIIRNMDRTLEKFIEQKRTFKDIGTSQKEKNTLNFNDKAKIKDFLKTQQQHESQMQKFSEQLRENLDKNLENDETNEFLKERLERQEIEAKRNQKLLDELNKIAEELDKEEMAKRLEELGKSRQNSERNLEQLLELTKRYYVSEKISQMSKEIEKLSVAQKILSELKIGEDFSEKEQEKLNDQFSKLSDEWKEVKKDNEDLKKPFKLDVKESDAEDIKKDQDNALEEINKHQKTEESSSSGAKQKSADKAKEKQKSASEKMKEMSKKLGTTSSSGSGGDTISEDADMLRQILDNLVVFSFKQENLLNNLEKTDAEVSQFSNTVKGQQELRELFEHVDDSLFSLSLRRAELSEFVNKQITEIYYNIDKSLESITGGQIYQGASYQKYVLNASNSLADFLANVLDNMQQNMQMGKGKGEGQGFQLPDIIKGQGELKEKMEGLGKSRQGKPSIGNGEGKEGEGGKQGQNGTKSGDGSEGKSSQSKEGKSGSMGQGGKEDRDGAPGNVENGAPSESELNELFEIYKNQQMLREQLEGQLKDMINASDRNLGEKLIKQMEDFERDLIENGVTQRGLSKINTIQYGLLKLENAAIKQGQKKERESSTNIQDYRAPITTRPTVLENYRNEIEILNRQALPLRQNFQNKVKVYFKGND